MDLLLLIVAAVCFGLAAFGALLGISSGKVSLVPLGLLAWVLTNLL